jgi:hypothetical protein
MKEFTVYEKCPACKGTGIYVGMAERDGMGVVCYQCKGTGCFHFTHTYEEFVVREKRTGVKQVLEVNPGIAVGTGNGSYKLSDFGGMPYSDWLLGKPFTVGMEMRKFTCPVQWYQTANYKKKPEWEECYSLLGSYISKCKNFPTKAACWRRWDEENK